MNKSVNIKTMNKIFHILFNDTSRIVWHELVNT